MVSAPTNDGPVVITYAITGASGAMLARAALKVLAEDDRIRRVDFLVSDTARRIFDHELGIKPSEDILKALLPGAGRAKFVSHGVEDFAACVSSGSYPSHGMIVMPCSMGTLGRIAAGVSMSLVDRAADVCLKEGRPLVLCPRETPLSRIHLSNMLTVCDAGATLFPITPAFYQKGRTLEDLAFQFACRVLGHMGFPQQGLFRWGIDPHDASSDTASPADTK